MFTPRRVRKQRRRTALVAALTGVAIAVAIVAITFFLATRSDDPQVHLGDDVFEVGRADRLAGPIERDGPLLFQDLVGRDRDLYVHHLGDDPDEGWIAFEATAPGAPRRCQLRWDEQDQSFLDPCTSRRYPADGDGLKRYPAEVDDDGLLRIDLRVTGSRPGRTMPD